MPQTFGGGSVYVSPEAALSYLKPNLAEAFPELFRWAKAFVREGDHVWDIGANVGVFAFAAGFMAGRKGSVAAFEPDTFLLDLMRRSLLIANVDCPFYTIPAAVGSHFGLTKLNIAEGGRCANFISSSQGSSMALGTRLSYHTLLLCLDDLLDFLPRPTILKVDVEGAELAVLRGSQKMLETCRPVLICEVQATNAGQVAEILSPIGYRMYDLDREPIASIETPSCNNLFVPEERLQHFAKLLNPASPEAWGS